MFESIGSETIKKLQPLFQEAENRLFGIGDTWLDRIDGAEIVIPEIRIKLSLKPIPKATAKSP